MPRPTRAQRLLIEERRARVAVSYGHGLTQYEIAQAEGVDRSTVSHDLEAIRKEWQADRTGSYEARLLGELARIDRIEAIALEAWERSRKDAETRHVRTEKPGGYYEGAPLPEKTIAEKVTKGQSGDPRFLERVSWCVEQRLKLIGAYAPIKVAPTTPDGNELPAATGLATVLDRLAAIALPRPAPGGAGGVAEPPPGGTGGAPSGEPGPAPDA
jgi:hypothetical protein